MLQSSTGSNGPYNFPQTKENIQLDLVGLLAVVGESAMTGHVQPVTASRTCLLPRLIPAPQSFLRTERPWRLPPNPSRVVGVRSGNYSATLNFFPGLLHGIDQLDRFSVRTISIRRAEAKKWKGITVHRLGPASVLSITGVLFFIGLLVAAIILQDGMAILAVSLLAITSSMVGLGSLWTVDLQRRATNRNVPDGDVVVIGRQGSFLHVKCPEDVARELYFGLERCNYSVSKDMFRMLAGGAMFFFMAAVVFMANCTWNLQAGLGLSYIILNGLYWLSALIPGKYQWDMSAYVVQKQERDMVGNGYTQALSYVIKSTQATEWIETANVVPRTKAWKNWVEEAQAKLEDPKWDCEASLTKWLQAAEKTKAAPKPGLTNARLASDAADVA